MDAANSRHGRGPPRLARRPSCDAAALPWRPVRTRSSLTPRQRVGSRLHRRDALSAFDRGLSGSRWAADVAVDGSTPGLEDPPSASGTWSVRRSRSGAPRRPQHAASRESPRSSADANRIQPTVLMSTPPGVTGWIASARIRPAAAITSADDEPHPQVRQPAPTSSEKPPSTISVWPRIISASGEQRNATAPAMSSGLDEPADRVRGAGARASPRGSGSARARPSRRRRPRRR